MTRATHGRDFGSLEALIVFLIPAPQHVAYLKVNDHFIHGREPNRLMSDLGLPRHLLRVLLQQLREQDKRYSWWVLQVRRYSSCQAVLPHVHVNVVVCTIRTVQTGERRRLRQPTLDKASRSRRQREPIGLSVRHDCLCAVVNHECAALVGSTLQLRVCRARDGGMRCHARLRYVGAEVQTATDRLHSTNSWTQRKLQEVVFVLAFSVCSTIPGYLTEGAVVWRVLLGCRFRAPCVN